MKRKMKIKTGVDLLMTALLLCLMAYQITGQALHEWFGTGMLILFIAHNLLNVRWYGSLFKGKYKPLRIVQTMINFGVLISMLLLGFSGIIMSRHVFAALPIGGPMATARRIHMAVSYWGFVLMSVHLGLHWGMIMGMLRKLSGGKPSALPAWILRLLAAGIAIYGAVCFYQADIVSYMFLKVEFAFLDYEKSGILILTEYASMTGLWVFLAYYGGVALRKTAKLKISEKSGEIQDGTGDSLIFG